MVEIPSEDEMHRLHGVVGDIDPFISPRDGTLIKSRAHLQDYMARHGLVHFEAGMEKQRQPSAAEVAHERRQLREFLWEKMNHAFSMGSKPPRYRKID